MAIFYCSMERHHCYSTFWNMFANGNPIDSEYVCDRFSQNFSPVKLLNRLNSITDGYSSQRAIQSEKGGALVHPKLNKQIGSVFIYYLRFTTEATWFSVHIVPRCHWTQIVDTELTGHLLDTFATGIRMRSTICLLTVVWRSRNHIRSANWSPKSGFNGCMAVLSSLGTSEDLLCESYFGFSVHADGEFVT